MSDRSQPANTTPTPPLTGVDHVQHSPAEVVTDIPDGLKGSGGLSPFPMATVIGTFRQDSTAIRGDGTLLMLQTVMQGLEETAHHQNIENNSIRGKLEAAQNEITRLSVENAVLKRDVEHKDSDKNARTAFVGLGGIGLGITVPMAVSAPSVTTIFCAFLSAAVFLCGLLYPIKGKERT